MVFLRETLINKNAQVFNVDIRLETTESDLVSKSLFGRTKNYEVGFINVNS